MNTTNFDMLIEYRPVLILVLGVYSIRFLYTIIFSWRNMTGLGKAFATINTIFPGIAELILCFDNEFYLNIFLWADIVIWMLTIASLLIYMGIKEIWNNRE